MSGYLENIRDGLRTQSPLLRDTTMIQSIEKRELMSVSFRGVTIHGTFHRPRPVEGELSFGRRVGVVFLNSLSLPRASTGDSAVWWADSLAESGYPTFRIDLPGLGDSPGDLPTNLLDFINAGGFAPAAADVAAELTERYRLPGVIFVGHCAACVSSIFAAARGAACKGLVLMDPYFHLPQAVRPAMRRRLSQWALESPLGRTASSIYDRVKEVRLLLRGNSLPENANRALIRSWRSVASAGIPVLMLKAPSRKAMGAGPRSGEFDYLAYARKIAGSRGRVDVRVIDRTDHSFANRHGRSQVRSQLESWLGANFPPASIDDRGPSRTASIAHLARVTATSVAGR